MFDSSSLTETERMARYLVRVYRQLGYWPNLLVHPTVSLDLVHEAIRLARLWAELDTPSS